MPTVATTRTARYSVLDVAPPGQPPEPAGVLLYDADADQLEIRLRRDWSAIVPEDEVEVFELLEEDLTAKSVDMGPRVFLEYLEDTLSNLLRISAPETVLVGNFTATLNRLYEKIVPATILRFQTHLPLYSCRAAAGRFGEQMRVEEESWVETPPGLRLTPDMFVATVVGRSMEPLISDGSRCVFRANVAGSREGKRVLVENLQESDEGGERYTVKRYRSVKTQTPEGWRHERIVMEPLNPAFDPWEIDPEAGEADRIRVIAEFVRVLD